MKTITLCDLNTLICRNNLCKNLRCYFWQQGFIEVETPILIQTNTPDPNIDPIIATTKSTTYQMHTSPEVWMKKALGLGAKKIFQLSHAFRDDPLGPIHSPEFSMLEWYRVGADLSDLLTDCQEIFDQAQLAVCDTLGINVEKPQFIYYELDELFAKQANIDLPQVLSATLNGNEYCLSNLLRDRGDHFPADAGFEEAFFHVMLKYIEPNLPKNKVSVLKKWPIQLAALSAGDPLDERYCQRFEIYFGGIEIANAYQECHDPQVLTDRFKAENLRRKTMGKALFSLDYELVSALEKLPRTAGVALGIDRLLLSMSGKDHLSEIILGYQKQ
ncbi:MAG: hypothetical protein KC505_05855 [Myxococcales bacterium]|nr:hypothetical protein [Myxococcales bacterium]USN49813.1 MAG: hypothetical protein H6731_05915 [Myxococcales bacterium]